MTVEPGAASEPETARVAALVLAGGEARRLGGIPKPLAQLPGGTMLEHVVSRVAPQAGSLIIATGPAGRWALPGPVQARSPVLVADEGASHRGPLAGLAAGLSRAREPDIADWLLVVPCDAPFLPLDLSTRLLAAARRQDVRMAMAIAEGHPQPTFSLWHVGLAPALAEVLDARNGPGLMALADSLPHARVAWAAGTPPPFFNINTPADLATARNWLDRDGVEG